MSKRKSPTVYTGEFKQMVIETMRSEHLSVNETAKQFGITSHMSIPNWERIYLEEGVEGLYIERRGRACATSGTHKGRPVGLKKEVEEDLIAEVQRLRAENAYLKNLQALVLDRERQQRKKP
ncbi:helix-turn-helix domain-containing protein [Bengtsoniella intestinalis]|uniref:transposase n=1 Tax=Bengtsoniella intestinalis TaxID=3073143 RepID=UPI00391F30EC